MDRDQIRTGSRIAWLVTLCAAAVTTVLWAFTAGRLEVPSDPLVPAETMELRLQAVDDIPAAVIEHARRLPEEALPVNPGLQAQIREEPAPEGPAAKHGAKDLGQLRYALEQVTAEIQQQAAQILGERIRRGECQTLHLAAGEEIRPPAPPGWACQMKITHQPDGTQIVKLAMLHSGDEQVMSTQHAEREWLRQRLGELEPVRR